MMLDISCQVTEHNAKLQHTTYTQSTVEDTASHINENSMLGVCFVRATFEGAMCVECRGPLHQPIFLQVNFLTVSASSEDLHMDVLIRSSMQNAIMPVHGL
jgi:hypothetical protein